MSAGIPSAPDPLDTLARTLWGEARGEGEAGMIAVAAVIRNRIDISAEHRGAYWWGRDWLSVCRAKGQFLCWNPGAPNRAKLRVVGDDDSNFRLAKQVAEHAIAGRIDDPTFGATHYKMASLPWPYRLGRFREPLIQIGNRAFYNLLVEP